MNIKYLFLMPAIFCITAYFSACKSFDESLLTRQSYIDKSVPSLRLIVNSKSIETCFPGDTEAQKEINAIIKNNFMSEGTPNSAYLSIIIRKVKLDKTHAWWLTGASLGTLNILGVPADSTTYRITIEAAILQSNGKILKTYSASAKDTEYQAFGWGYSQPDSRKLAYVQSIYLACGEIKNQLKNDAENINSIIGQR